MWYLYEIAVEMPKEPHDAEEHLSELIRGGYLTEGYAAYLYRTYIEGVR